MTASAPDRFPVVCIAASAGGLHALEVVLGALPATLGAAVVVVQHLSPDHRSALREILDRATPLRVRTAEPGSLLEPGTVFVAPPDHHLVVGAGDSLWLSSDPPVHFLRPSADRLFATAATQLGRRVVAVVLTGTGADGAAGVEEVVAAGGRVVIEDPDTAAHGGMPAAAVATEVPAVVVPLAEVAAAVSRAVSSVAGDVVA